MADKSVRVSEVEILITGEGDPVIDGGNLSAPLEMTGENGTITRGMVSGSLETPAAVSGELGVILDES